MNEIKKIFRLSPKKYFYILSVLILCITSTASTSAVSDFFSDSNIQFYDPNACDPNGGASEGGDSTGTGGGGPIYMLGDSITVLAKRKLNTEFSKSTLNVKKINADVGRAITRDTTKDAEGRYAPGGTQSVKDDKNDIKNSKTAIIALGTNSSGGVDDLNRDIPKLIDAVKDANANIKIYWVNVFADKSKVPGRDSINAKIKDLSSREGFSIIDLTDKNIPLSDGIHPTDDGGGKFAKEIVSELNSGSASGATRYVAKGNIPKGGKKYIASVYGTTGSKDKNGKYIENLSGMEGGPNDEKGKPLKGRAVVAEMSSNTALGSLPYGSKIEITYKGKSIIAEVSDNGPGAGGHSDIDLWRQTADLLDFPYGKEKVTIKGVPNSTPTTPVDGSASTASDSGSSDNAAACCPSNNTAQTITSTDSDGDTAGGGTDIEKLYNKLIDLGLKPKAAAGIAGNTVYESGGARPDSEDLNTRASNGTHWGIVQWDSGRWAKLENFAKEKNKSKYSLMLQAEFIMEELNGPYKSVKNEMEAASSASEAALIANRKYEVTGVQQGRAEAAKRIYKKYGGGSSVPDSSSATISSSCVCDDPTASSGGNLANPRSLKEFVKNYSDPALAAAKNAGIPYDAMLAQIAHESGIPLSQLASKYNNFGGIKYTGKGRATPPMATTEEGQGTIMARFRWFATPQEGLEQQAKFFTEYSRYRQALKYPRNPVQFIREIKKAGYATDAQYVPKMVSMLRQVQSMLTSLGKPLSKDVQPTVTHGSDNSDNPTTTADCSGGQGAVVDGFAFPVGGLKKNEVGANNPLPCNNSSGCHHDGTAAFDLGKGTNGILNNNSKGLPVYAIEDGKITTYRPAYTYGGESFPGCPTYQLKGKSGWVYWYGHTAKSTLRQGSTVKAGEKIAEIGESRCTGNDSAPHLHIDRGTPKGSPGGGPSSRDKSMVDLINKLWKALP